MTIILIAVWLNVGIGDGRTAASVVVEFNSMEACQIAGKLIASQSSERPQVLACVPKGSVK